MLAILTTFAVLIITTQSVDTDLLCSSDDWTGEGTATFSGTSPNCTVDSSDFKGYYSGNSNTTYSEFILSITINMHNDVGIFAFLSDPSSDYPSWQRDGYEMRIYPFDGRICLYYALGAAIDELVSCNDGVIFNGNNQDHRFEITSESGVITIYMDDELIISAGQDPTRRTDGTFGLICHGSTTYSQSTTQTIGTRNPTQTSVTPTKFPTQNPSQAPSKFPTKFPTTAAPTTAPPTTATPTTATPTTATPTTATPTTAAPTTATPTTAAPTTATPTTATPTTATPTTAPPTTATPTTATPTMGTAPPTTATPTTPCILGENYEFIGHPVYAYGDPHFRMWNGDNHDFQGAPMSTGAMNYDRQYYYITRKQGSTTIDLPYNVIARHRQAYRHPLGAVDYITLELFDSNGDIYLIFLSFRPGYTKYHYTPIPLVWSTGYSTLFAHHTGLATFGINSAIPTNIGQLFKADIQLTSVPTPWGPMQGWKFTLEVNNFCNLEIFLIECGVIVTPPDCYKCHIAGLFGDFSAPPTGSIYTAIQTCTGPYIGITDGWQSSLAQLTAYSGNALTWLTSVCIRGGSRRRLQNLDVEGPPDAFVYVENCPEGSAMAEAASDACQNVGNQFADLCDEIEDLCDKLISDCEYDACVLAEGNIAAVDGVARQLLGDIIGFLTSDEIIGLFDPDFVPESVPGTTIDGDDSDDSPDSSSDEVNFADFMGDNLIGNDNEESIREIVVTVDSSTVWNVLGFVILNMCVCIICAIYLRTKHDK